VGVARGREPHRLEDEERHPLAQHARVLEEVVEHEALVPVELLPGNDVLVELDLEAGFLFVARVFFARADADLPHGDFVDGQVGGVVLVREVVVLQRFSR
jgi:hypothetical protein